MARSVSVPDESEGSVQQTSRRKSQRKRPPRLQSSVASEIQSSSDDSLVFLPRKPASSTKSKQPQIEEIIKRKPDRASQEPSYVCKKKGSKDLITLTETELKHVPDMLASFKRRQKVITIPDSDDRSSSPLEASSDSPELSDQSDRSNFRVKKSKGLIRRGRKDVSKNQKATRRSTRGTRSQKTFDFQVDRDDEEQTLRESSTDVAPQTRKRGRPGRRAANSSHPSSSEEDLLEESPRSKSSNRRSRNVTNANAHTHISHRPCDEHQPTCSKCYEKFKPDLVKIWLRNDKNRKRRVSAGSFLDRFPDLEAVYKQGCWLECTICTNSYHFGCLPYDMKKDISTQHKKERLELMRLREAQDPNTDQELIVVPPEKKEQQPDLKLTLKCPSCVKPHCTQCVICAQPAPLIKNMQKGVSTVPTTETQSKTPEDLGQVAVKSQNNLVPAPPTKFEEETLIFRCTSCKRASHYGCLPSRAKDYPTDFDDIVEYWHTDWTCADCDELADISVESILAWRKPVPKQDIAKGVQPGTAERIGELRDQPKDDSSGIKASALPNPKDPFEPAEYLCKYENFSFTDCSWVTHSYLCAKHPALLRNFLTRGPTLDLKQYSGDGFAESSDSDSDSDSTRGGRLPFTLNPDETADQKIPPPWLTPEKILSIEFENELLIQDAREADLPDTPEEMYEQMERAFIKWGEQSYADATWSDKTPKDSPYFPAFMSALRKYMKFRNFVVPRVKSSSELAKLDAPRKKKSFVALEKQPSFIPNRLMGFQLEGLNFCYYNWHNQHPTILADEMGLGKTVQICSLIAILKKKEKRMPFLIVVPNSTLGNWARECAKWIPDLKCVSLPGDSESCKIVQEWELFQTSTKTKRQLAACVVLATYQSAEKHANLLREVQRWEVLVVDEGQRLKAGAKSGLFRALSSLTVGHKILMSGTPLNNNLRELFNLLSFLNPSEYPSEVIDELELRYSALTPELIDELRAKIRPYMLRRTKETVLDLPPLTEIIVPITMRPLQKQVYRGLLSRNADLITSIYTKSGQKKKSTRSGFQNLLMQLRKTLAHPYLYDAEIEPSNVSSIQAHENLVEASAKLVFLQKFIPKLLARGHRMLIFSQFTMFLDVIERFLDNEKWQYLRLDGSTSQLDRQTRIDHFNRTDTIYNIFLLSTRAGGAGINLATADVVIVLDPDWNPHNDLQAISRAHRFGQKKPVSVFKMMVKGSAEEKIVQTGKKKLVLDHLVIQKASEEEIEAHDVASILQFGAQELLTASDETLKKDVRYTDAELDDLIQRTVDEAKSQETPDGDLHKPDKSFAFARIWEGRGKDLATLDVTQDDDDASNAQDQRTFWDSILQANEAERAKARQEEAGTGRGHRKRKDVDYHMTHQGPNLDSPKKKSRVDSDLSNAEDDNYEPVDGAVSVSSGSLAEPDALVDVESLLPPPTDLQLRNNREAEDAIKAERRKLKLQNKYAKIERSQEAARALASKPTIGQIQGTSDSPTHTHHSNQVSSHHLPNAKKASKVAIIQVPDLKGLSNDERRRTMDTILRDLIAKAQALKSPSLDAIISSVRSKGQAEQVRLMTEALKIVKELASQARLSNSNTALRQHPSIPHQSSSAQPPRQPTLQQHQAMSQHPQHQPTSYHPMSYSPMSHQPMSQPHPSMSQQQAQNQANVPARYYVPQRPVPLQISHQSVAQQHKVIPQATSGHHPVIYDLTQASQSRQYPPAGYQPARKSFGGRNSAITNNTTTSTDISSTQAPTQPSVSVSSSTLPEIIPISQLPPPRFSDTNPKSSLRSLQEDSTLNHSFLR